MVRVTRAESQAETRRRLIRAAAAEFAERGFGGASLDRIADVAGFTRGAVYSNFADKADLFVAVLDHRLDDQIDELAGVIGDADATAEPFVARLRADDWTQRNPEHGRLQWILLYDEFRIFALRNPSARARLAVHEQRMRDEYARAAREFLEPLGLGDAFDPSTLGAMLFGLDHDLNRQELIDPDHVPKTSFADTVAILLQAAAALGDARSGQR